MTPEIISQKLTKLLNYPNEWLLINSAGKSFSLKKDEIEFESKRGRVLISFLDDRGFQTWRVTNFEQVKREIVLELTRNFEREREKLRFVPRVSAEELGAEVELARLEKANEIGKLLVSEIQNTKLIRVQLNKENGRFAQVVIEKQKQQIAVLADVSDSLTPEVHISYAFVWLSKLGSRKKNPIDETWILAEKKLARNLQKLHACLRESWKYQIKIKEISKTEAKKQCEKITNKKSLKISDLWREKPAKLKLSESNELSQMAREIIEFAPEKIDCLFTKHGETLRYLGLPFVRIRKMLDKDKSWFGIEREKRILSDKTWEDFEKLIEDLKLYRSFDSPNKQHAFYKESPEAWLESILRHNIKLLDVNLILSPIYNQFRTLRDKIDLLALRRDGRLIIIELKVSPDREMIFQAVDYWRKIELQRRKGKLNEAKIFGKKEIADKPTLVYLVAPAMSFHRDFNFLAKTVSEEIEIYRFDLAINWREDLKVLGRRKI
jgi:hypothetical protein